KYTLSFSARKDESNIFGVATNMLGVPLYSTGLLWNLHKERFYSFAPVSKLSLRITYGSSGNVDKRSSAYVTASASSTENFHHGGKYQTIIIPPNPELRWERVNMANAAVDFAAFGGLLSGTVEVYRKKAIDL